MEPKQNNGIIENDDKIIFDEGGLEENESSKKKSPIYVVRKYGFNFEENASQKYPEVNKAILEERMAKDSSYDRLEIMVGVKIKNKGEEPISDIIIPEYTLNTEDEKWYGIEKSITLQPEESVIMPYKYFVALMLKQESGLKFGNGRILPEINKKAAEMKDYDAMLNSMPLEFDTEWADIMNADGALFPIGLAVYSEESGDMPEYWEVRDDYKEIVERFAYLNNGIQKGEKKQAVKEINIDENDDAAKLLAGIINMGKKK